MGLLSNGGSVSGGSVSGGFVSGGFVQWGFCTAPVCVCVCVCVGVRACVCPSQVIAWKLLKSSSLNLEKLEMGMHQVLIILTLTFIQGHTYLDHTNNKCMIISETF